MTPLDQLCQIPFHDAPAAARARILSRIADTEFFAALTHEPAGDQAELQIFALPDGPVALACDAEERLAGFLGGPVAYLALPGRILAGALAAEGRGLLINPGHPSEMLLDSALLAWLVQTLQAQPSLAPDEAPRAITPPDADAAQRLAAPLGQRLGDMRDLVRAAGLMACEWADGRKNHLLVLRDVPQDRRDAVAKAFAELLAFLPEAPGGTDIAFSDQDLPAQALPIIAPPVAPEPPAPQRDPNAPPRLR
ncbi:SseB family protein [Paracoccus shanxieyensis]|uniref:SseB protein N-terminal domain-containing protein n=1 Tax=Paracoccus shanxieyensis TaxID=2675752 RepID=A0A6L6IVK6_9RHOB|nr:SseB family protein [Paracoccus shanxieyensis]MTH63618.1 hypothetical protein [Paracoccus shanxieyensis]MTH86540.1 hypothetical protein [Paracoccus shanxieyensis]